MFASADRVSDLTDRCIELDLRLAELEDLLEIQDHRIEELENRIRRLL